MKKNVLFIVLTSALVLFLSGSCFQQTNKTAKAELLDSASIAREAKNELTLDILKAKKEMAQQRAVEAEAELEKAKVKARASLDAAKQASRAYETEQKAQESRRAANKQAKKSDKANSKL